MLAQLRPDRHAEAAGESQMTGIVATVGIALSSGFASVYTEKVIKRHSAPAAGGDVPSGLAYTQIQLAATSLLIEGTWAFVTDSAAIAEHGLWCPAGVERPRPLRLLSDCTSWPRRGRDLSPQNLPLWPRRRRDLFPRIYPRHGRGGAATRSRGFIHVLAAAAPRPVPVGYPRRGRGGAATRPRGISTSWLRRRRDPSPRHIPRIVWNRYGFDHKAAIAAANSAAGGLTVAAVLKFADAVLKGYATAISVLLTGGLSVLFFGTTLSVEYALGMVNVAARRGTPRGGRGGSRRRGGGSRRRRGGGGGTRIAGTYFRLSLQREGPLRERVVGRPSLFVVARAAGRPE